VSHKTPQISIILQQISPKYGLGGGEDHLRHVPAADGGEVGQLLDDDGAVVEGGLMLLGDGVGHQHGQHDGEDVAQVTGGLAHQQRRGDGVGHRAREGGSASRGEARRVGG